MSMVGSFSRLHFLLKFIPPIGAITFGLLSSQSIGWTQAIFHEICIFFY